MTYDEAVDENPTISKAVALREIKAHGADLAEFFEGVGNKDEYGASEVLIWLGY